MLLAYPHFQASCPDPIRGAPAVGARAGVVVTHRELSGGFLQHYILKLYVTGRTSNSEAAIANLRRTCEEALPGRYELQIIDVLEHPELAEDDKVLATPTLIKKLPPPLRRVIGDLSDKHKVLLGLEVQPDTAPHVEREPS